MGILNVINLIQKLYFMQGKDSDDSYKAFILISFCTLGEMLLDNFLTILMIAEKIPKSVQDRLLNDHRYPKQRIMKLFLAVVSVSWKDALSSINNDDVDYSAVSDFYIEAYEERNNFIHKGDKYGITADIIDKCINHIQPLLHMFAELHNAYVYPAFSKHKKV
ncbi:MAG: hypothetical protein JW871_01755 [Endomicrobiales bacterium]|nr:hypothetical protein [Endomicrobiales bacterium]